MKTRFPVPARLTRVRRFRSKAALQAALEGALVVLDGGVPAFEAPGAPYRVAGGEGSKRWGEVEGILAWLARLGAERSRPLVVVGGGATLDLGALAASLYRRGMPLVLVPTTLLGMVDATLGGKTAVDGEIDGRLLKNFAGSFYPAAEVWLCSEFLKTLPRRERVSGAGEVYKTMWIRGKKWDDRALGEYVDAGKVSPGLEEIVRHCLAAKAKLVEKDPLDEKRVREALNFGHTVGHALESAAAGRLSHGECVLWGMILESKLLGNAGLRMLATALAAATGPLRLESPPELQHFSQAEWERFLGADKKAKGGRIEMSLLTAPGKVVKKRFAPAEVARVIRGFQA